MGKRHKLLIYVMFILSICSLIISVSNYNISKQRGLYIGKIESISQKDGTTIMEVSPVSSKLFFVSEIKGNHQIEYADDIRISGVSDPGKNSKRLRLGELGEMLENLKVGDDILFKFENGYDKNIHNLKVKELAVDLTLE